MFENHLKLADALVILETLEASATKVMGAQNQCPGCSLPVSTVASEGSHGSAFNVVQFLIGEVTSGQGVSHAGNEDVAKEDKRIVVSQVTAIDHLGKFLAFGL